MILALTNDPWADHLKYLDTAERASSLNQLEAAVSVRSKYRHAIYLELRHVQMPRFIRRTLHGTRILSVR